MHFTRYRQQFISGPGICASVAEHIAGQRFAEKQRDPRWSRSERCAIHDVVIVGLPLEFAPVHRRLVLGSKESEGSAENGHRVVAPSLHLYTVPVIRIFPESCFSRFDVLLVAFYFVASAQFQIPTSGPFTVDTSPEAQCSHIIRMLRSMIFYLLFYFRVLLPVQYVLPFFLP